MGLNTLAENAKKDLVEPRMMAALAVLIGTSTNQELMNSLTEHVSYPENIDEAEMLRMADRARKLVEARNYESPVDPLGSFTDQVLP